MSRDSRRRSATGVLCARLRVASLNAAALFAAAAIALLGGAARSARLSDEIRAELGITLPANASTTAELPVGAEPEVICSADSLFVAFYASVPFEGVVYVHGRLEEREQCVHTANWLNHVSVLVPHNDSCGVTRHRTFSPPGIKFTVRLMVAFHPKAIRTWMDRLVAIECFHPVGDRRVGEVMQLDRKGELITHSTSGGLSPSDEIGEQRTMPECSYQILSVEGGAPVRSARIGDNVTHWWSCRWPDAERGAPSGGKWCLFVSHCELRDGMRSGEHTLIDGSGCSTDGRLFAAGIDYRSDTEAVLRARVFAFTEASLIYFRCAMRLAAVDRGARCPRPSCGDDDGDDDGGESEWKKPHGSVDPVPIAVSQITRDTQLIDTVHYAAATGDVVSLNGVTADSDEVVCLAKSTFYYALALFSFACLVIPVLVACLTAYCVRRFGNSRDRRRIFSTSAANF